MILYKILLVVSDTDSDFYPTFNFFINRTRVLTPAKIRNFRTDDDEAHDVQALEERMEAAFNNEMRAAAAVR